MIWREATRADVPAVVALLADDVLGQGRESADLAPYLAAFDAMQDEGGNRLIVAEQDGRVVACYQLTLISGLSLTAARRAQVEGVRVAGDLRGRLPTDPADHQRHPHRRAPLLCPARLYPLAYQL